MLKFSMLQGALPQVSLTETRKKAKLVTVSNRFKTGSHADMCIVFAINQVLFSFSFEPVICNWEKN